MLRFSRNHSTCQRRLAHRVAKFSSSSDSSKAEAKKVFELRTYNISPNNFANFVALTKQHISKRLQYSRLLGYWTSEISDNINQVVHLWEYNDPDHRTAVRKALATDEGWMEGYMTKMRPLLVSQHNMMLKQFLWYPLGSLSQQESNIYELRMYRLQPGQIPKWAERFQGGLPARLNYSRPYGVFFSDIGELNSVAHIWPYRSLGHRAEVREAAVQNKEWASTVAETMPYIQKMNSKILHPAEWSPLK